MRLALAVVLAAGPLAACGTDDTVETRVIAAAPSSTSSPSTSTTTTAAPPPPPTTTVTTPPKPPRSSRSSGARSTPAEEQPLPAPEPVAGRRDLGVFEATCYDLRGTTASGRPAGPGSIAVDPRVIPLGTRLHVEGYGDGIAADTGGAIKGRIIDVWKSSGCLEWGRRRVHVEALDS